MPLAIEVTFGAGRYAAADVNDRHKPEWPPHPARLFSALVEAWARYGSDPPDPGEGAALEWLERQPPPTIFETGGSPRNAVGLYVPANNETVPSKEDGRRGVTKWWTLVPAERKRLPRASVPSTLVGEDGRVVFSWSESEQVAEHRPALSTLVARVTRMGHSSSFVSCRLIDDAPDPVWVPCSGSSGAAFSVRGTYGGMLEMLVARHETYLKTGLRNIPMGCSTVYYSLAGASVGNGLWPAAEAGGEWLLFEMERPSRSWPCAYAATIAKALRGAVISHCSDPPPRLVVGKDADGSPTAEPHALFVTLPFVGGRFSDGTVKGAAVILPPRPEPGERRVLLRALGKWESASGERPLELRLGRLGALHLRRVAGSVEAGSRTLDQDRWCGPSRRWSSVTALALPREGYKLTRGSPSDIRRAWRKAEEAVVEACRFVGLPDPDMVEVGFDPPVSGGSHTADYPPFIQSGRKRLLLHATVNFNTPVLGPVVLGCGRFRGLGLMRPMCPTEA